MKWRILAAVPKTAESWSLDTSDTAVHRSDRAYTRYQHGRQQSRYDNCGRLQSFKLIEFFKSKDCTKVALESYIADLISPVGINAEAICTDNVRKFKDTFEHKLDDFSFTQNLTPTDTPQYNGVAEKTLSLIREKMIPLFEDLMEQETGAHVKRFWVEVWNYATIATNM